jgi:putative phosphoesterase
MKIGVVSDTHGHVSYTLEAVRMLESLAVELVIHCGDIGTAEIVDLFAAWPTHFVFGNVDHSPFLEALSLPPGRRRMSALVRWSWRAVKSRFCTATIRHF